MKKYFALILALLMVLSLAACGGEKPVDDPAGGDVSYVQDKGTLVVGITDFAPMDYQDGNGEWIGFDADMAKLFAESLGVDAEFVEIANWDLKAVDLETKAIDVVWNGMTITEEVTSLMGVGDAYCKNAQVVVVKAGTEAPADAEAVKACGLNFAVENGSAGAEALDELGLAYTACDTQAKALMEVASGSSDACVIDLMMAGAMIGAGTSYPDLVSAAELTVEEYGVGFRVDSDLVGAFNDFWKAAYADGTVMELATTYGIAQNIIAK